MGAVNFSIDIHLVQNLKSALSLEVFVETGTYKGDTVAELLDYFDRLITVEFSEILWKEAFARFKRRSNVEVFFGSSPEILTQNRQKFVDRPTLFWLDAHWCNSNFTEGLNSQCPLVEEINAIGKINSNSVILIDDARLFLAPPLKPHCIDQWPSFQKIVTSLRELSDRHELMVVNDVIAFFPSHARDAMDSYAQTFGIDWLEASNCLKADGKFMQLLASKEFKIQEKEAAIHEKENVILEQLARILDLEKTLKSKNATIELISVFRSVTFLMKLVDAFRRLVEIISPRLGDLRQYVPRPMTRLSQVNARVNSQAAPTISIVTPSYQQGAFIERTMDSVLAQGYPNLEYFIQDGGSTDETQDILVFYDKQLSGWQSRTDGGQSEAINLGFLNTSGEIMAWLNSDDILLPGALATVANFFTKHPEVDVVYGNRLLIDENDMEIGRWIMPSHDGEVLSWVDYVPQETLFWRRRVWDRVGGQIDESFKFAMDWDLLVRFRDVGATFAHIPRFLGAFRVHEHQKTSANMLEDGHNEMDRIRERALGRVPGREEIQKAVLPFLLRHIAIDIRYRIKDRLRGES